MNHGGKRPHAGRKKGSGRYGEPTRAMRVPISRVEEILRLLQSPLEKRTHIVSEPTLEDLYWRPLYDAAISFPVPIPHPEPAEKFNLNTYLLPHPERMAFVRAPDRAMRGSGIDEGDILIVDTHRPLISGCLIAAIVNDELLIRRVMNDKEELLLIAANSLYLPLHLSGDIYFMLLGVVKTVVREC
jgi:DNA polymerase V